MEQMGNQGRELHEFIDIETGEIVLVALTPEEFSLYLKSLVGGTRFDWEDEEDEEGEGGSR